MKDKKKEQVELMRKTPETGNPFQVMRRFTKDMERLFENFQGFSFPKFFEMDFAPFRSEREEFEWLPRVEVMRNNGEFMVRADLAGLKKEDVNVELTNEMMSISGERKEEKQEKEEGFYRSEFSYGNFYRQIPLPEGAQTEKASATFRNGVLEVTMPAAKATAPTRKLDIKEPINENVARATA